MPTAVPAHSGVFVTLEPELRLLLSCLRWPLREDDRASIHDLALQTAMDWTSFAVLFRQHRVGPLVYRALTAADAKVPSALAAELKNAAVENAHAAMRYLRETNRLCNLLERAGVSVRVLKGVPLSQQVYGDPGLRDVGDIDLLIAPGQEEAADDALLADGFRRTEPAACLTPARRRSWSRHGKDYTYAAERSGFEVDLHWRLFRNPRMPGNALAQIADVRVHFGGLALPTMAPLPSFLYLCVHGALEGWLRFKSLADVGAFWRGFSEEQRREAVNCARLHQVLPELASALLFAGELRLLDPESLSPAMQLAASSREARHILGYARTLHTAQDYRPTSGDPGSWALKRYEFGLRRNAWYRAEIVRRILFRPRVWEQVDLPDALFPLYALLSPLEWVLFHRPRSSSPVLALPQRTRWARWRGLPFARRVLLLEAFASLAAARIALAVLPVRAVFRWLASPLRRATRRPTRRSLPDTAEQVRWAVLTAARYGPGTFVCFPQALAAHAMLRRRGIPSVMHYGVRRSLDQQLRAHTWLEVGDRMLLGGEGAPLFIPLHSTGPIKPQSPPV